MYHCKVIFGSLIFKNAVYLYLHPVRGRVIEGEVSETIKAYSESLEAGKVTMCEGIRDIIIWFAHKYLLNKYRLQ